MWCIVCYRCHYLYHSGWHFIQPRATEDELQYIVPSEGYSTTFICDSPSKDYQTTLVCNCPLKDEQVTSTLPSVIVILCERRCSPLTGNWLNSPCSLLRYLTEILPCLSIRCLFHLKNGSVCAAHHRCMQYSYFLGQYKFKKFGGFKIDEVLKEMKRAKKLKCVLCKKSKLNGGASAKCGYYYCNRSFHYYCAQTNDKCFVRRICIRRQKSSRPIILYRIFCSKEHEKKCLDRGALFQEAFSGLDSYDDDDDDDDISDSSGENQCVQGSVNLLDQKTSKLTGQQQSLTDLTSQAAASLNKADSLLSNGYMQVQDQKKQAAQPEVYSEETLIIENELLLPSSEFTGRNTLEYQHQNNSNDSLENGCSDVESLAQTEPTLISLNSTPPEIRVSPDEEEENGPVNLQVETLSVDLTNCTQPSSPHITSSQEQETMVLCICRNKKCDLQSQSRILRICKNRYQASKMNIFFWHDIMPPSFKPEYLPYFFLDIVECLRLKMYEVFFTLLFRFDQKHSEKFQYLIDIEDDSVIKEQEDNIWTTVASYLKKASLDSAKLNFCVILKIVPSQTTCDNGNLSQTEKCKKRLGDVSEVVNAEKRAKF
ncbi:PHF6 [Acanthosepion pharaonis]|uniref:PHF6 n=1 Tax=Acanthosepion pharaonis TaxID=158019 RepID=A0A812B0K8_ACAPH|nr:PHF6 [Sepia pharaonis]